MGGGWSGGFEPQEIDEFKGLKVKLNLRII